MTDATAPLRPEIEQASRTALQDGRWDDAIFDAMRLVEARLQSQTGSALIGNPLVNLAFDPTSPRVRISPTPVDAQRLAELFRGALGFLKGDRSHKDRPAVPCPDEVHCRLALGLASYLLDLLDLDEAVAPAIRAVGAENEQTLELETLRTSPTTRVVVHGGPAQIVARDGELIRVRLEGSATALEIRLVDGRRSSPSVMYTRQPRAQDDNFHYVEGVGIRVFDALTLGSERSFTAVRLRSYQGGRRFVMHYPAGRAFTVGEYVGWDWDMRQVAGESWLDEGVAPRRYAWTSSGFFAGAHLADRGTPELVDLQIRPRTVRMRPGSRGPLRVIAFYRDGPACWREDVTADATIESLDPNVLLVTADPALIAKRGGTTEVRARYQQRLARASVVVAALAGGTVVEWFGGYRRMVALQPHADGLLIAHQSDHLLAVRTSQRIEPIAHVEVPETAPNGLDTMTSSPAGDLYLRAIWSNDLVEITRASGFTRSVRLANAGERNAYMSMAWSTQLGGLLVGDAAATIWLWRPASGIAPWCRLPFNAVGLYPTEDALLIAPGGGALTGYGRMAWSTQTLTMVTPDRPIVGSALLPRTDDVLLASFHEGRIYSLRGTSGTAELFAEGFTNPISLATDEAGDIYVANFGGDSISRVLS